jgi:hypothetical protein
MSRFTNRGALSADIRLMWLENDMDEVEIVVERFDSKLTNIQRLLVGILVSVTTASILLVINVIVIGQQ